MTVVLERLQYVSMCLARKKLKSGLSLLIALGMVGLVLLTSVVRADATSLTPLRPAIAASASVASPTSLCPTNAFPPVPTATVPADPNSFLTFLELNVPQNDDTATAYYKAIDPQNLRLTLPDWLVLNGFIQKASDFPPFGTDKDAAVKRDAFAIYINNVDLGVTRRFYSLTDAKGNVAIYTENYRCLADAKQRNDPLATVAMEWRAAADGSNPTKRFTTFYAYGGDNKRLLHINLDGRGDKALPGNCQICHGGNPRTLDASGNFPNHGNIGAYFLPWDINAFIFDTEKPEFSRAAQEPQIKKLSQAAYATYSKKAKFDEVGGYSRILALGELVEGWYGGPGLPSPTYIDTFTPQGWLPPLAPANAQELYQKVIAPTCRTCHMSRERSLDFTSYRGFAVFHDATQELVFKVLNAADHGGTPHGGVMPLALKTYINFWTSDAPTVLRKHLDLMKGLPKAAAVTHEQTDEQADEDTSQEPYKMYLPSILQQ